MAMYPVPISAIDSDTDSETTGHSLIERASYNATGRARKATLVLCVCALVAVIFATAGGTKKPAAGGAKTGVDIDAKLTTLQEVAHQCPAGYTPINMDMVNRDADLHESALTLQDCTRKCDADDRCKGVEYNQLAKHCWTSRSGHHCTMKQMDNWVSCRREGVDITTDGVCPGVATDKSEQPGSAANVAECPDGYEMTTLDMLNHDATLHESVLTLPECAKKCDDDTACKGLEYSVHAKHCWTSQTGHHQTARQMKSWLSCKKKAAAMKITTKSAAMKITTKMTTTNGPTTSLDGTVRAKR